MVLTGFYRVKPFIIDMMTVFQLKMLTVRGRPLKHSNGWNILNALYQSIFVNPLIFQKKKFRIQKDFQLYNSFLGQLLM